MIIHLNPISTSVLPARRGAEAVRQRHLQLRRRLQPRQPLRLPARRRRLSARLQGRIRQSSLSAEFLQMSRQSHSFEHLPEDLIALPSMACRTGSTVCGSDGRTYGSECELLRHSCRHKLHLFITSYTPCRGMHCSCIHPRYLCKHHKRSPQDKHFFLHQSILRASSRAPYIHLLCFILVHHPYAHAFTSGKFGRPMYMYPQIPEFSEHRAIT